MSEKTSATQMILHLYLKEKLTGDVIAEKTGKKLTYVKQIIKDYNKGKKKFLEGKIMVVSTTPVAETPEVKTCYLCKTPLKQSEEQSIGHGLYRHKKCTPKNGD